MERKMKYYIILLTLSIGVMIAGCAKLEDNITQPKTLTVHKQGIMNPHDTLNFHGNLVRRNGWSMDYCKQCHAANFSGGTAGQSCLQCHTGPRGPLSCNTCHGIFSDPTKIAPPRGVNGDTASSYRGVGAHYAHLYGSTLGTARCSNCHIVPDSVYSPGHLDSGLPAEVNFDSLAKYNVASNAAYNPADSKCSNTYCHGNFAFTKANAPAERKFAYISDQITGNNKTVQFTKVDGSEAACGSCHGLPPAGHLVVAVNQCVSCHPTVIDENGKIIDKTKHMNGKVDYGTYITPKKK